MPQDTFEQILQTTRKFFKSSTLVILLFLIFTQFINLKFHVKVIPEVISVGVAFVCIFYLWIAELIDMSNLQEANLKLIKAQEALKVSHVETVLALVLSQEAKDSYTYGHSERVKQFSIMIAREMDLPQDEIEMIARGAKLHDIGKIGIKDDILFCAGGLTEEQLGIVRSHPLKGVMILDPLKFLDREKLIVRHHHERFDGSGYPDRLKGEEIPLGARIVGVADALDAMKSQRLYRRALTKEEIIQQFQKNAGTQFDPKIVDVLVKNIDHFYA